MDPSEPPIRKDIYQTREKGFKAPAMDSINPLDTESWGGQPKRRVMKHQEAWSNHYLPTSTEVLQYLTSTSAIPMYRTAEQEWNVKERNEDSLGLGGTY